MPGVGTGPELPQRVSREDSNLDAPDDACMHRLFLLITHVAVPGNYRVKGIKRDRIPPRQSLTVSHLHRTLAATLPAFAGATSISVTQERNLKDFQSD